MLLGVTLRLNMERYLQLKEHLNCWLGMYPDSDHPSDNINYFKMVEYAKNNGLLDSLLKIDLKILVKENQPDWSDEYVDYFVAKWGDFIEHDVHLLKFL